MADVVKAQQQDGTPVGVVVLAGGGDFYWRVYHMEDYNKLLKASGDWQTVINEDDAPKPLLEPGSTAEMFQKARVNNWVVAAVGEGEFY